MAVLISIQRQKAFLRRGEWVCADATIESQLNAASTEWFRDGGAPVFGRRDPEHLLAAAMAERFGGRILLRTSPNTRVNRRIYFSKRQLPLDFGSHES